ncbi:MAG: histidinol-phosphatase HisJ family protein [Promethearchaeota archaeon]
MKFKYTDYHVHTFPWSVDIKENGPIFEDYIHLAEKSRINVCFLEHFELYYIEMDKTYPFYDDKINDYLEEIDTLKETYDFILGGLEVEYYSDRDIKLREFMDDYGRELDFIAGSIHEWVFNYPITTREKLLQFLERKPMQQIIDEYFEVYEKMINSEIFKNVCHIDTIFRYINNNDIKPDDDCDISDERVLELGRLCIKNKINIEYNLSGLKFPIKHTFPSKEIVRQLKYEGGKFFVGSDSHSIKYFEKQIPKVKEAYNFLNSTKLM